MDFLNSRYCTLSRILLSANGLWPYQNIWFAYVIRYTVYFILGSSIFVQILYCFTSSIDMDHFVDAVPSVVVPLVSLVLAYHHWSNNDRLKIIFDRIQEDWIYLKAKDESDIMHKHAEIGRLINLFYTIYSLGGVFLYGLSSMNPLVLDIILPLNESRPRALPFKAEFFINNDEHFISLLCYMNTVIMTLEAVVMSNQALLMVYIHHATGMFAVLGYRLEHVFDINKNMPTKCFISENTTKYKIILCAEIHQKATELASMIDFCYAGYFLSLLSASVISMSFFLVHVLSFSFHSERAMRGLAFIFGDMIHTFLNSYMGQKLIDMSVKISEASYCTTWYNKPAKLRKFLVMMMMRSIKPCSITAGRLYALSFENFSNIVRAIVSYCMVIRQVALD